MRSPNTSTFHIESNISAHYLAHERLELTAAQHYGLKHFRPSNGDRHQLVRAKLRMAFGDTWSLRPKTGARLTKSKNQISERWLPRRSDGCHDFGATGVGLHINMSSVLSFRRGLDILRLYERTHHLDSIWNFLGFVRIHHCFTRSSTVPELSISGVALSIPNRGSAMENEQTAGMNNISRSNGTTNTRKPVAAATIEPRASRSQCSQMMEVEYFLSYYECSAIRITKVDSPHTKPCWSGYPISKSGGLQSSTLKPNPVLYKETGLPLEIRH